MPKFIPREKLGKKARRALDAEKRATWGFSPVTRKVESKKHYDRKKSAHAWKDDFGMGAFACPQGSRAQSSFAGRGSPAHCEGVQPTAWWKTLLK